MSSDPALPVPHASLIRVSFETALGLLVIVGAGMLVICATGMLYFNPARIVIYGPAGTAHEAYIEDRSCDDDRNFVLCAWDWPHTFVNPAILGAAGGEVYWSLDGSVLTMRYLRSIGYGFEDAFLVWETAYDYRTHTLIENEPARIKALIQSRGGLGSEVTGVPGPKGSSQAANVSPSRAK